MKRLLTIAGAGLASVGLLLAGGGPALAETTPQPVSSAVVTPLSVDVQSASKTDRYVTTATALYDTQARKVVKRFPSRASIVSLSDDGRYVTYTLPGASGREVRGKLTSQWDYKQNTVKVFDRKTRKTRTATTTQSGKALRPAWRSPCLAGSSACEEGFDIAWAPGLVGGQISGNGRYVVFCANYATPQRVDLYIKDLRTKRLAVRKGACAYEDDYMEDRLRAPSISEDGGTILLPGSGSSGEEGIGRWGPSRALINRARLIEVGGYAPTITHDGKTISVKGAFQSDSYTYDDQPVTWLDLPTGTRTPADPTDLQLTMQNASRHGRYVVIHTRDTSDPWGARLIVKDRTLGVDHDLTPALAAAGYTLPDWSRPILTGDGRTVFVQTQQGPWVTIRWLP